MSKPRLNLDLFSSEGAVSEKKREHAAPSSGSAEESGKEAGTAPSGSVPRSPKFVPVGFYPEHLRLLDDAVLRLRRQGHWTASKSAIIRALIVRNADRLDKLWLAEHVDGVGQ